MKFASKLVTFDSCPGDSYRPIATPIYQTATFAQEQADSFGEYDYSRSGNPTRTVLETQLALLENGTRAFCFASGMAAIAAVMRLLRPGDEVVAGNDLYGGTCRLLSKILNRSGISVRYLDPHNIDRFAESLAPSTRLIFMESPTNPLFQVVDLRALAEVAHARGALLCVDNSSMSPYLQNPLDLGADIVVHSATKYLSGHSDVMAGVVVVKDLGLAEETYFVQNAEGAALGPFDSYLVLRGLKTLKIRMDCQQQNALAVARFLANQPKVTNVYYPGLPEAHGFHLHHRQARGAGAVLSFTTGSFEFSRDLVEAVRIFRICVSFGSVHSSISLPGCMSHASIPAEVRDSVHVPSDTVRLSVGIEDSEDLISDLDEAFRFATTKSAPGAVSQERAAAD